MPRLSLTDFSGGLNLRDAPNEIAANETPDALNWTLDTRGQARLRNGSEQVVSLPGTSGKAAFIFYSQAIDQWLCARESAAALHLFTSPVAAGGAPTGVWTDRGSINASPTAFAAFVDFPGSTPKVVLCSGLVGSTNGDTRTWDGTTLTVVATIQGSALAVWQNRVWLAGYTTSGASGNPTRLFASKVGDPTTWAVPDGLTVDIRDKDAQPLTGFGIAGGALIVFKRRSAHRVTDSATGAFTTIDSTAGSMSSFSVVPLRGRLYTWGADSLYEWDGVGPGKRIGDKARPLFATDAALVGGVPALCGGVVEDRVLLAYPSSAGGNNDRLLEYDPEHGWLMKHQLASSSSDEISSFARKDGDLYAAVLDGGVVYRVMTPVVGVAPGGDNGVLAANKFRSNWLPLAAAKLARVQQAIVGSAPITSATTTLALRVYRDYDLTSYDEYDLSSDFRDLNTNHQIKTAILRSLGHGRSFSFEFIAGTAAGATSINSLSLDWLPLER